MHKPFEVLEQWVKDGRLFVGAAGAAGAVGAARAEEALARPAEPEEAAPMPVLPDNLPDTDLFQFAMKDVRALGWSDVPLHHRPPLEIQPQDDELEALRVLEEFMRKGNIRIEQTAEYIEGSVQPHGRLYLDDLRSGRFSVQAHLDLHGMNQQEARFALDEFLMESIRLGFSCVRVIHGRGHHSHKHHPVLKENIQRWLCHRRLGRHVIAYTSARVCDGGGGAVYVLLRK